MSGKEQTGTTIHNPLRFLSVDDVEAANEGQKAGLTSTDPQVHPA